MFIMLYDLEGELDSVKFTYQTMKDTIPESVTKDDFNSLCKKLIVEARDTPASSSTSTTANAARKTDNQRGGGGRGRGGGGPRPRRRTQCFVGHQDRHKDRGRNVIFL